MAYSKEQQEKGFRELDLLYFVSPSSLQITSQESRGSNFIHIDCWNTSQVFKVGHRIGLEISSSAFPKYDRNLNTGAPLGITTEMMVAEQRIFHDGKHPSAVVLLVIPKS